MKKILSALIFFAILIGLFHAANVMLFEKQHFGTAKNVAYEEPEKIDVFFIGASHIFYGINPMEIWEETGISGYNLTTHQQPLWASKLLLQHALKKQHPKLIVLDVLMATNFSRPLLDTDLGVNMTHLALDPVPLTPQKIKGVLETDAITRKGEILFPIILSHSRLQQGLLTYDDMHFFSGDRSHPMKGYNFIENRVKYKAPEKVPDTVHELPDGMDELLRDFIRFCREQDLPLLMIKTPLKGNDELYEQINYIGRLAEEEGVPFIDFNHLYEEIGFDFSTDLADSGHLNLSGSRKVSRWLADYLAANYDLPDHRGDSAYESWDRSDRHYRFLTDLRESKDILPYLEASVSDPNMMTVILSGGKMQEPVALPDEVVSAFRSAGLSADAPVLSGEGAYIAVIRGGKVIIEKSSHSDVLTEEILIKDEHFQLQASPREPDGGSYMTVMHIGSGGYYSLEPGLLAVTYDCYRMQPVDAVRYAFDETLTAEHLP